MSEVADKSRLAHAETKKLKTLQLKTHLGLGDAFVYQGMVHHFLTTGRYSKVVINTRTGYLPDLALLYGHLGSSVEVQPINTYKPIPNAGCDEVICTGFYNPDDTLDKSFNKYFWDREFYRQAGVRFIERWLGCYLPTLQIKRMPKRRDFVVRHHDPDRDCLIEGIKPDIDIVAGERERLLDWMPELMVAREIHCIDSCVLNLAESMHFQQLLRKDVKLVYHAYARDEPPPVLLAPWEVIV